ncbi:hypothetical protein JZ751_028444 [Albula glossodonta]|uniref:Uncharacterized protein n=1 Tax=Albula glossodonta TaxID=121402 RepID=A0A8T2NAW8_9TELE|nr:hypothetical protein JZ751_028444 [Albula glossodonta]
MASELWEATIPKGQGCHTADSFPVGSAMSLEQQEAELQDTMITSEEVMDYICAASRIQEAGVRGPADCFPDGSTGVSHKRPQQHLAYNLNESGLCSSVISTRMLSAKGYPALLTTPTTVSLFLQVGQGRMSFQAGQSHGEVGGGRMPLSIS